MNKNDYPKEMLKSIADAIEGNIDSIKAMQDECKEKPVKEVAIQTLVDKFGISKLEAEDIVDDLKKGADEFDSLLKTNTKNGKVCVAAQMADMTKDMTEERRLDLYASLLTSLQLIRKEDVTEEEIATMKDENLKKDIPQLAEAIEKALNEDLPLDAAAKIVKEGVNAESLSKLADAVRMNKDDFRFMTALWMYIVQREGKIKFNESGTQLPPNALGALAGAGIETIIATDDLNNGTIDLTEWQEILKWILGALLVTLLLLVTLWGFVSLSFPVIFLILDALGTGFLGFMATFVAIASLGLSIGVISYYVSDYILKLLDPVYDKLIVPITNFITNMIGKIKVKFNTTNDAITTTKENGKKEENPRKGNGVVNEPPLTEPEIPEGLVPAMA